jgi:RNA-directed DNA polymerase
VWVAEADIRTIAKVKAETGRNRVGIKGRSRVIAEVNVIPARLGQLLRTGNASTRFNESDRYVAWRLKRLLVKRKSRNLRAGEADRWTAAWLQGMDLHQLMGTVRYPGTE